MRTSRSTQQLTPGMVEELRNKGLNQSEIARASGVSRQWVSLLKHQNPRHYKTPRETVLQAWPYQVPAAQQQMPYKRLRDHAEYVETGGKGMDEAKLKRLRGFYKRLRDENAVVEFDPSIPPIPGISSTGGWAFRERQPADGVLLIRVNEHTRLTEDGKRIWRFPRRDP